MADIHHVSKEDLKNKLPRGDEIDRVYRGDFDKFQQTRTPQQGSNPLPNLPLHRKIEE